MFIRKELSGVAALLNYMIGGSIMGLPLYGKDAGWALILPINLIFCFFSAYSCRLLVLHLGHCKDSKQFIFEHFSNKFYALVIFNGITSLASYLSIVNYFTLILLQLNGLFQTQNTISFLIFFVTLTLTILARVFSFGILLLAFGSLSILFFLIFLLWCLLTAPTGPKIFPVAGNYLDISASILMGYSIHDSVVQILLDTTSVHNYKKSVSVVYLMSLLIYLMISYSGFGFLNREIYGQNSENIQFFFPLKSPPRMILYSLYLFHLFTVIPQDLIMVRMNCFQILKINQTPKINYKQVIFYVFILSSCVFFILTDIKLSVIIEINGSVVSVIYIFILPIILHLKCQYLNEHDQQRQMISIKQSERGEQIRYLGQCGCRLQSRSRMMKIGELFLLGIILVTSLFVVIYSLKMTFYAPEDDQKLIVTTPINTIQL